MSVLRLASVIGLRPEKEAEYRALHADAWPGGLAPVGTNVATIRAELVQP